MAIKDEISRLQQAKQDFKTKLIEKGVAVSDEELISDYPPKLDLIKGGTDTSDATATANEIRKGFTAYVASGKVEGAIEDYDGSFEGGVEISGGGVSIPSVTDLTCDSEGNVSWTAPNFDSLASYNPTISYVVSVNGNEVETTTTNVNIANYLVEGTNVISVKVKAIINHYGNVENVSVEYSKPVTSIVKLPLFIPKKISATSSVLINTNAYIFGGYTGGFENTIYKFDTKAETIAKLTATLPEGRDATSAAAVGTNAYIFGGNNKNTIYKFDSTTQTTTTVGVTLPNFLAYSSAISKGTNIYIFGGQNNSGRVNTIYKFDTTTETLTMLNTTLPVALYKASVVLIGNNAYIFGGYGTASLNTIYKFDTETETITTLQTTLPVALSATSAAAVGTNAYIFGGTTGTRVNTIYKFDTTTETITKLDLTLPIEIASTSAVAINGKAYIFGGDTGTRVYADTIYKFTA